MSGHWPPEWEDQEEEFPGEADQLDAEAEARLSEVAAYLASIPDPVLPDAVSARISAALAAESASRAATVPPSGEAGDAVQGDAAQRKEAAASRTVGPAPARPHAGRRRDSGRGRQSRRLRPVMTIGSLVACLLLAGLVYALSRAPSSYSGSVQPNSAAAPAAGSNSAPVSGPGAPAAAGRPAASAAGSRFSSAGATGPEASFAVIASGTRYQQATLARQVQARMALPAGTADHRASLAPGASGIAPSPALRGCVLHLTGGALPQLVDRATYQGKPAYIVASSSRVWVVGLGCTAAKTELVVSVALASLPGNLWALVSVEQYAANLLIPT